MNAMRKTAIILGALAAVALTARCSSAATSAARAPGLRAPALVEFTIGENFTTETVTCGDFFGQADASGYGHIDGKSCTATGALDDVTGDQGDTTLDLVPVMHATGCRVESMTLYPGYFHLAINCTSAP